MILSLELDHYSFLLKSRGLLRILKRFQKEISRWSWVQPRKEGVLLYDSDYWRCSCQCGEEGEGTFDALAVIYSSKLMLLHNSLDCVIGLSSDNVINGRIVYMGLVYYLPRNDYLRSC